MRFQLDHDWQGNMATPRARIGESAKTHLLIVLCAIWILLGLIGHHPWKPLESNGISIVKGLLEGSSWLAPLATGEASLKTPPLYYLSAAAGAKVFSPLLSLHDGARLINALWLTITLLMVGMAGRELWDRGVGRHATFIMMGTIGLVLTAHSLTAEVAALASAATGFYALALSKRRPWRASALLGSALAVGFLSYGVMPVLILLATALLLPLLFKPWRTPGYTTVISVGILIASPFILTWVLMLHFQTPLLLAEWWQMSLASFSQRNHAYFLRILIWYAWPALPLALWGIWRYRSQLLIKPKFQLMLVFFAASLVLLGFGASNKDINALPQVVLSI
jgi:4-amino-4-deoxy-L-arabinose transferase-like glycosyltransferase